ncbi:MAG: hypothetical protein HY574_00020 [candidate division NC10 bacterium]|nr:hypothetical protein [candidate division NC10 bacterium]
MTSLRRLMGLPRLPIRIYVLILALFLVLAYIVTGPAHQFFAQLRSSLGSFDEPTDRDREEYLKIIEQEKR